MNEQMEFPETFEEFAKEYGFKDDKEVYTNGSDLIPICRVKQWLEHISTTKNDLSSGLEKNSKKLEKDFGESDCISRADVNQVIEDYMDEQYHVLSDRTKERAFGARVVMARINELDPVTPQEPCEMTVEEYRQRMIQAFHNADADELIAVCVLPTEKEFEHLEWLLKNHYKKELCEDAVSRQPKMGHWIYDYTTEDGHRIYHCSECGCYLKPKHSEPLNSFKWCSLCGAKMVESEESEEV